MMSDLHVLRSAGTALVVDATGEGLPRVLHWGADLPDEAVAGLPAVAAGPVAPSALDQPWPLTVLPGEADGWLGHPAYAGHRAGCSAAARWVADTRSEGDAITVTARDPLLGLAAVVAYRLDPYGVLAVSLSLTHEGPAHEGPADGDPADGDPADGGPADGLVDHVLDLAALRAVLPLPTRATEVLDLTGRWCRERSPQRAPLVDGTHLRASRRGRTGHDATLLLAVGTAGFGFRSGEVWAAHLAWSGNHEHLVERLPEGAGMHRSVLAVGELLSAGEIRLAVGESYAAPEALFVHSSAGLDGLSSRLHRRQRAATGYRAGSPRPLVLNTWEAVYFDHRLDTLTRLADTAASIGVERFVLDDGWFGARRDDTRGLGDWQVSPEVWPEGLGPLADHVHGLGLEFGLWFEPEMVNLDSDVVRAHPEWVLGPRAGHPRPWRGQQVLDLANPAAAAYLLDSISALVSDLGIDFIKWDHNRDLMEAVRSDELGTDRPAVHAQTVAVYALLDELRARHPDLEIESCASGGARVDLGILAHTDRVWTSDNNDALERARIQRWTTLLVPPELMGAHIGPPTAHTSHRTLDLSFRALVALQGHAGLEWDITTCDDAELATLRAWSALYRELRPLLHSGDLVRADLPEDTTLVQGVVSGDRTEAVFTVACLETAPAATPGLVPLPGLDEEREYAVRVRLEAGEPAVVQHAPPGWWAAASAGEVGFRASGALLARVGLPLPVLAPGQGFLLHLT